MNVLTGDRPPSGTDACVVTRTDVRFSADGDHAACLAHTDDGGSFIETWSLTGDSPARTTRVDADGDARRITYLALNDGRVLLAGQRGDAIHLTIADPRGSVMDLGPHAADALKLTTAPGCSGALALGISVRGDDRVTLYRITDTTQPIRRLADIDGALAATGTWIGECVLLVHYAGGVRRTIAVDARTGTVSDLPDGRRWIPLCGGTDRLLAAVDTAGRPRLGVLDKAAPASPRLVPERPIEGRVTPVALRPDGRTAALVAVRGTRSLLVLLDLSTGTVHKVAGLDGAVAPSATWNAHGLWAVHETPTDPRYLTRIDPEAARANLPARTGPHRWSNAERVTFAGPAGPIEAVRYGAPPRSAHRVVVALHGGPHEHWTFGFDRQHQALADAGLTVIAPNQRGSTGYGTAHEEAIHGAWGGPDLADIQTIARAIVAEGHRDRPALFGVSYGAFLAVLCSLAEPSLWSRCAAVAPLVSARSLYDDGGAPVRNLITRTRALEEIDDELGPRDLVRLAPRARIHYLIAHGARDATIPVGQSRALVNALRRALPTATSATNEWVRYLEVPDAGHELFTDDAADPLLARITEFLSTGDGERWRSS